MTNELERAYANGWANGVDAARQRFLGKLWPLITHKDGRTMLSIEWRHLLDIVKGIK